MNLRARTLWTDPASLMAREAIRCATSMPEYAAVCRTLAQYPVATWFGDWTQDPRWDVATLIARAALELPVLVAYNIPGRDGGSYSAGGAVSEIAYRGWIDSFANGISGSPLVILEPDALAMIADLPRDRQEERYRCLGYAVDRLTAAGALVYLDAGDSNWIPAGAMAIRLTTAGISRCRGFALNVAHYENSPSTHIYAQDLRQWIGGDPKYVIDTSRNGRGSNGAWGEAGWCNAKGAGIGARPTLKTTAAVHPGFEARLWVKGFSSDGSCGDAPPAGAPYPEYVMELFRLAIPAFR